MNEQLVMFGERKDLVGVMSTPDSGAATPVACLFPNVGLAHRIGPHRLNVRMCRALAQQGYTSLRFDLSGIGDSAAARSQAHFMDQAVRDMQAAMDHLEASAGIRRFVVFGICSGAVNGYFLTLADPRVVGVLMLDGFTYPSLYSQAMNALQLLRTTPWSTLKAKAMRRVQRLFSKGGDGEATVIDLDPDTMKPSRPAFQAAMDKMLERGVNVYFIFSDSLYVRDSNRERLSAFAKAPFMRHVRYEFMPEMDHTATPVASQQRLIAAVHDWTRSIALQQA